MVTNLSAYNNSWYNPGGGSIKRLLWYFVNEMIIRNKCIPVSSLKVVLLRLFGAKVGAGVVIKPGVNIKYPWRLSVGNYCWIGEDVWIDNLDQVTIGNNVCISQGALLLCGNHDYKKSTFDLMTGSINIEDGAWVGAKSVVCPGVVLRTHAILTVGSVASSSLDAYGIYRGNPAVKVRERSGE
jgi:putative colanic acid biosynthesis acetyltransferase WcaF